MFCSIDFIRCCIAEALLRGGYYAALNRVDEFVFATGMETACQMSMQRGRELRPIYTVLVLVVLSAISATGPS